MKETLGYRVKQARKYNKLTQDALADQLNALGGENSKINRGMLSKWENDRESPTLDNMRLLSKFFQKPMDYFAVTDDVEIEGLSSAIKHCREESQLSVAEVAETVGVSEADWLRYEAGDAISHTILKSFANQILSQGYYEFLDNNGLYDEYIPPEFDGDADAYEAFKAAREQDWINEAAERFNKQVRSIPLLGTIAAGAPILADDHIEDYIEISLDVKADFALRVQGDSMIDANIHDGDIVFIHQQPSVENGEIAAVMLIDETTSDGIATLKRVYKTPNGLQLIPENRNYAPIIIDQSNGEGAKILGKATFYITQAK
ncbi:MAG: S24 family peptidase [Peptococcaceae bacterium]